MINNDYPVLKFSTAASARSFKKKYYILIWLHAGLLLLGAIIASLPIKHVILFTIAALIFFSGLFISVFLKIIQYEKKWYGARAITETIKSMTWRI